MTLDELAVIRLALPKGHFWMALQRYHETSAGHSGWAKADRFLKNFAAWRRLARQVSLSRCLEAVLGETHYAEWLLTQPRGEQRRANVQRLLALAQQFDQFQRQGLFRFLRFIEAQQAAETEPQVAAVSGEDSVSLMSIHQSKGLEFPVVAVADLGKPFNTGDLRAEIILDTHYGLCPQIKPPHTGRRYPSLPYWLAQRRQKQEMLGEELRLLYVAMTRARDTLILSGSVAEKKFQKQWQNPSDLKTASLLSARNYLDWLAAWCGNHAAEIPSASEGENEWLRWTIYNDLDERLTDETQQLPIAAGSDELGADLGEKGWKKLRQRLAWQYPRVAATHEPAKTSVSALRRRMEDEAEFSVSSFKFQVGNRMRMPKSGLSAEEIGTAHHTFLELVSLERTATMAGLKEEAERMEREHALTAEELGRLDFDALAEFWQSEIGQEIRAQSKAVRRELAFTARFTPGELRARAKEVADVLDDEFVVVQGIADLAIVLPEEIRLLDFKTDQFDVSQLPEKVKLYEPQLRLYALALERIYQRPVSKVYLHFLAVRKTVEVEEK